jgi:hypothetical protein
MFGFRRSMIVVAGSGLLTLVAASSAGAGVISAQSTPAVISSGAGNVSGVVTIAATGKPLKKACVNVIEASDNQTVGTSAPSSKTGAWSLDGIPASTDYTATAGSCTGGKYVGQWYNHVNFQSVANQFAVAAGGTTTGINFSLSPAGKIAGKVTNSVTKKPVQGILVIALWTTDDSASTFSECTSASGKYKLTGVPTSGAKIEFLANDCGITSDYGTVFYQNAPDYSSASVVPVVAGKATTNINQAVTLGG